MAETAHFVTKMIYKIIQHNLRVPRRKRNKTY
jgi:hypothetical protein